MYNILIVEDEYLSRYVLTTIIHEELKNNVNIIQAENGFQAKEIIDNNKIDLGIVDMRLPGIKGIEICKYLRIKYDEIPIIIITGDYDNDLSKKILNLNINEYLVKPVEPSYIIKLVNKYIKLTDKKDEDFNKKREDYLKNIIKPLIRGEKRETIHITEEYINFLYDFGEDRDKNNEIIYLFNEIKGVNNKINMCNCKSIDDKIKYLENNILPYKDKELIKKEFIKIYNHIFDDDNYNGFNQGINTYIKDAINYVEKNIRKNITLEEVANSINITPHYLSKIFKREVGVNFITFITDKKIELAKKMLIEGDIPIVNIAIELSYTQPNYFSKVFKKKVGVTPREYRERYFENNLMIKNN